MFTHRKLALLSLVFSAAAIAAAYALEATRTPLGVNETGENSASQAQVVDVARFKPGFGTIAASGGPTAFTATLNNAAGIITTTGMTLAASGAGACPNTITLTNSKIQAGDIVLAVLDSTNSAAGAPSIGSVKVSANTAVILICNDSTTAMTSSNISVSYFVITQGNPN